MLKFIFSDFDTFLNINNLFKAKPADEKSCLAITIPEVPIMCSPVFIFS
jgi:hypothetical protein